MLVRMTQPDATASVAVQAPADLVYAMVSDVPRMPEWAVECEHNSWLGRDGGPRVGARFRGHNHKGLFHWWTTATVTAADPGRRFAFRVTSLGLPVAAWAYDIEPTPDGCVVTESTWYQVSWVHRHLARCRRRRAPCRRRPRGRAGAHDAGGRLPQVPRRRAARRRR